MASVIDTNIKGFLSEMPPVGFFLRHRYFENWTRIHSLPESKRYPENDEETAIILERFSQIAQSYMPENAYYIFITINEFFDKKEVKGVKSICQKYHLDRELHYSIEQSDQHEKGEWTTFYGRIESTTETISLLIKQVEDHEIVNVAVASLSLKEIIMPYEGGFDILCSDLDKKKCLEEKFLGWMSKHESGL